MADLKISQLTALDGTLVAANDELPIVDSSASETKKVTPEGLVSAGIRLLPPGSIDFSKINGASVSIPDGSVTTVKLADGAVTTVKVVDGAITDAKITGPISVSKLGNQAANVVLAGPATGGVAAPTFRAIVPADLPKGSATVVGAVSVPTAGGLAVDSNGAVSLSTIGGGGTSPVVTYDTTGRVTAGRALAASDLPLATAGAVGAVSVPTIGGLVVNSNGAISLSTVATAGSSPVVTYDAFGRITAGRALTDADLPLATAGAVGAVKPGAGLTVDGAGGLTVGLTAAMLPVATSTTVGAVKPSADLAVAADGTLTIANSVTAGTSAKVTYDANGLVTAGGSLVAADIPGLDASKVVSGTFGTAQIANRSITQAKLADYSVSYIQESAPVVSPGAYHIGTLWFQESTARLSMFNGNSWMTVGQGALSNQNLRFCGLFDASTGQVTALTSFGTSDGFVTGAGIPAAASNFTGAYFVCDVDGNGTSVTPAVPYDAGDWIVCLGTRWERVDTLNGGGGGGASTLAGLTDTNITTPANGDLLVFNGSNWVNRQGNLDPGTYS